MRRTTCDINYRIQSLYYTLLATVYKSRINENPFAARHIASVNFGMYKNMICFCNK